MNPTFTVHCQCGFQREGIESHIAAEVVADRHESAQVRRAYQHDTTILQEAR